MTITAGIILLVAVGLSLLVAVLLVTGTNRLRRIRPSAGSLQSGGAAAPSGPRPAGAVDRQASAAAEMLETIIQRRMAADPAFRGQGIDFGSSADGSLEIWWKDQAYTSVDQLPDVRLRELIAQAIEEFNRGESGSG